MLRQWRSSGLSVRAFCRSHGLSEPSFYSWRRVLAQRAAAPPAFVPVQVIAEAGPADTGGSGIELVLDGQRVLRIGPAFDAPTLRRLLAVLQEGRP
jgi:hypothetical protein